MKHLVIQIIDTEQKKVTNQLTIIKGIERIKSKEYSGTEKKYIILYEDFAQIESQETIVGKLLDIIDEFNKPTK